MVTSEWKESTDGGRTWAHYKKVTRHDVEDNEIFTTVTVYRNNNKTYERSFEGSVEPNWLCYRGK